ncbi:serine/threonine-protein kinase [Streptomyces sp. NBC_00878]|uniref:serine/threonine-protein kinase n=1 Tax=Streptomyces sp. NBC_00878 TaxID=2975854 RepID=UPI0022515E54|nr:serine/threonine-protein kinase [Streptomyces sp. NBC_00878]MCX4907315.1 protein kinase [Streptomyces sp. NBC_00878]
MNGSIGRGGMGEVWQATDEVLGREVAVKLLLGDEADSAAAARFRLEAQTAARLSHPYVVAVFDFGAWDDRFYLVMELVEGQSLAQELTAAGTLGTERVATVAAQAAAGLAAAHREGIVHRDIKPGNLLADAQGTVKIGDFGIARFVDDPSSALTTAGQIVGTSLYLAPERALGRPASAASDVYSLGCVLYQLLTGRPPFRAESATVTLHQHIDMAPVPPRERGVQLPPAFESYLLGLLAKKPEDRPTAQEVADWFGTGAWRGPAEPLPVASGTTPTPRPSALSASPSYDSRPSRSASAESGPSTMYRLPPTAAQPARPAQAAAHATHSAHAAHSANAAHAARSMPSAPSRRARSGGARPGGGRSGSARSGGGVGAMARRRPLGLAVLAGAVLFVLAVLAGMKIFAPDNTAAETGTGRKDGSSTGPENTEAPAAGTVARTGTPDSAPAPGDDVNAEPPASPSLSESPVATPTPAEDEAEAEEKQPKDQKDPKQEELPQPPPQYGDDGDDGDDDGYEED